MGKLTAHFTLEEFLRSSVAKDRGIDNTKGYDIGKITLLALMLERIRAKAGFPIWISSGYRCPKLNAAVKGSKTSLHLKSEAADIKACKGHTNKELFNVIKEMVLSKEIEIGQLIDEYDFSWVHVSLPRKGKPNNQILALK